MTCQLLRSIKSCYAIRHFRLVGNEEVVNYNKKNLINYDFCRNEINKNNNTRNYNTFAKRQVVNLHLIEYIKYAGGNTLGIRMNND